MVGGRKFDVRNPAATVGEVLRVCCAQLSMWSVETKTHRAPKKTRPETEGSTASRERKGRLFCPAAVSAVASALVGRAIFQAIPPSVETWTRPSVKVL
jgi:hypothetical protein